MNKKKKLEIAAGKYFKSRSGGKVFVVGQNPFEPTHCWIVVDKLYPNAPYTVTNEGFYSLGDQNPCDLIREIKEPKKCQKK